MKQEADEEHGDVPTTTSHFAEGAMAKNDSSPSSSSSSSPSSQAQNIDNPNKNRGLTGGEIWNLTFALFAWACTVTNSTVVVGSSAVVLLSIGGDRNLTSLPLGAFMFGAAFVSLSVTPWLFVKVGRKLGFLCGIALGLIGTGLGCACIAVESVFLLIVAMVFFGMSVGVGFFLRFASVELVPPHWRAKAVALVVSGGVLAAFVGPEAAQGMKDAIDNDNDELEFMGTFVIAGVCCVANAFFTTLIDFPSDSTTTLESKGSSKDNGVSGSTRPSIWSVINTRQFIIPMLISTIAWSAMGMPMSIVRVVMKEVGFTSRQSLTTIEFHFFGMYSPGFVTGPLISLYGPKRIALVGIFIFAGAFAFNFTAQGKNDEGDKDSKVALWLLGLFLVGVAWNFCFTSATVWTTTLYKKEPSLKPQVQAANDFLMFLLSGAWIVSASYIFEKGGNGLDGWDVLNWVALGLVGLMGVLIALDSCLARLEPQPPAAAADTMKTVETDKERSYEADATIPQYDGSKG